MHYHHTHNIHVHVCAVALPSRSESVTMTAVAEVVAPLCTGAILVTVVCEPLELGAEVICMYMYM